MNTPEIKAGQRWVSISGAKIFVEWCDGENVLFKDERGRLDIRSIRYFFATFNPCHEPKTRPITKDDIMKMLAVNPVIFCCHNISSEWGMLIAPVCWVSNGENKLDEYQFSHNPFAPNAKIVGPEIEVTE
jgi:hypothetical protein